MDDRQVRDEVMTFFIAGHETTALALSWAFYALSRNPAAERKLREELDRVLAGRIPSLSDVPALVWTECVIKETLRLYPPAWALGRITLEGFELAGYQIPKGSLIVMSPWVMQRHERYFPDAETFDPARWNTGSTENLPRFAYFPFGGGPRQCIGKDFAIMEAVLLLATIAQSFELRLNAGAHAAPIIGFTLRPRNDSRCALCFGTKLAATLVSPGIAGPPLSLRRPPRAVNGPKRRRRRLTRKQEATGGLARRQGR